MAEYRIRQATIDDCMAIVEGLLEMFDECGHRDKALVKGANFVQHTVEQNRCFVLVCDGDDGEVIVGSMALDLYQPWWTEEFQAMDHWIYVLPDWRTRAAFQTMVDHAVHWAAKMGVPLYLGIHVRGAERKRALYARLMEETLAVYQTNYAGGEFRPAQGG